MVEVEVDGESSARAAVYTASPDLSLLRPSSVAERKSVNLVAQNGDWTASALGLQHLLPTIPTEVEVGVTTLLSTSARPNVNPWGALVNSGTPTPCHGATTFFKECSRNARIWLRETTEAVGSPFAVTSPEMCASECAANAGPEQQCMVAQCSSKDGSCVFTLNQPDGYRCDDGDPTTLRDECDGGECRGWTLIARQGATEPLTMYQADYVRDLETVTIGNSTFNLAEAARLKGDRTHIELALVWPDTLFSAQVWSQESMPWELPGTGKADGFIAQRVSLIGFTGLVGGGNERDPHFSVMREPTINLEIGATSLYLNGIAGPGILPVNAVELYARSPKTSDYDRNKAIATGIGIGAAVLIILWVAYFVWRRKQRKAEVEKSISAQKGDVKYDVAEAGASAVSNVDIAVSLEDGNGGNGGDRIKLEASSILIETNGGADCPTLKTRDAVLPF